MYFWLIFLVVRGLFVFFRKTKWWLKKKYLEKALDPKKWSWWFFFIRHNFVLGCCVFFVSLFNQAGNAVEALRRYSVAVALNPDDHLLHSNRSMALAALHRWKESEEVRSIKTKAIYGEIHWEKVHHDRKSWWTKEGSWSFLLFFFQSLLEMNHSFFFFSF